MASDAERSLRAWVREREVEQSERLRLVDRAVARVAEIDRERVDLLADIDTAMARLDELGVCVEQIASFIGSDPRLLGSTARPATVGRRRPPRPTATVVVAGIDEPSVS